ncbi:MAG TPA: MFS transporter [Isosphaeraceae bacterium]|nr:MFS transporter [Isosphaeraceae bacterium]
MKASVRWRLSAMMALIYAVQGSWWPLLAVHLRDLGITGRARGWIFATMALASLATPLGAGQLADRFMATQRLLALLYTLGTGLLIVVAWASPAHAGMLFLIFLLYWLLTAPATALSNSLALRNLQRPLEQFGRVRLWGTVGWLAVGWVVTAVMAVSGAVHAGQGAHAAFAVGAALSALLAVFCLTLPHTPPLAVDSSATAAPWKALGLVVRRPRVAVYLLTAFGVCLTTPFVYQVIPAYLETRGLPRPWTASAMTLGQVPEILALWGMPWMLCRFGYRGTLGLGIAAWAVRYGSLIADPPLWIAVAGVPLHGVGVACFTIGGQMYLDGEAPADLRASVQALNVVVTSGIGMLLGSLLAGETVMQSHVRPGLVFLVPCLINTGLLLYFVQCFRPSGTSIERGVRRSISRSPVGDDARTALLRVGSLGAGSADG